MTPTQTSRRPYLAFVRAGRESLHRRIIAENPDRNWDCCVSWYVPPEEEALAEHYSSGGFNKLDGFLEFWKSQPHPWPWRYTAVLDDDVYLKPGALSYFFEECERRGAYLAQPGLNWFTNITLKMLVRNPACIARRVSYVEVMAPTFSAQALKDLIHTFDWTRSTWGTDVAWGCLSEGQQPLYVIDAVGMDHTRTGDGRPTAFYRKLAAMGINPGQELAGIRARFPGFGGQRVLRKGHVFRPGIPPSLAPALMWSFERLKFIARTRRQWARQLRILRARMEDLGRRQTT
jgi:hypothetical protein